ncbi:unnamed protein product, partial [Phaeothamnion confervicola]
MLQLFTSKTSKAKKFWAWFADNRERFETLLAGCKSPEQGVTAEFQAFMDGLTTALHRYDTRIFPFCGQTHEGVFEFIITAEGNVAAFDSVYRLVAEAPKLGTWNFIPLKPRQTFDGIARGPTSQLDPSTLRYALGGDFGKPYIILIAPELDQEHFEEQQFLAAMLMDTLLGEEDFARRVEGVELVS